MHTPAQAIGWELWQRNRTGGACLVATLGFGGLLALVGRNQPQWKHWIESTSYALLVIAVFLTFGSLHFTEGHRRGGFGRFPIRLFTLPASTFRLVAWPMTFGILAVVMVYLGGVWVLFAPLGEMPPRLWPCLYLVCGITQYQMIVWSFPESRYLKLLLLSTSASLLTFGWMFFLPHLIEGSLRDWGYTGSVESFEAWLLAGLAAAGPASFGFAYHRIRRQRHGKSARGWPRFSGMIDRILEVLPTRKVRLHSVTAALFWREWRQTGLILPLSVAVVLVLTCLPGYLSAPLSGAVTFGLLVWMLGSPWLLSAILGSGFSKVDFWSADLGIPPFHAARPFSAGAWVMAKLKVAALSVLITWGMLLYVSFFWTAWVGDFESLDAFYFDLSLHYRPALRPLLLGLSLVVAVVVTWRLMVQALMVGLSGRHRAYQVYNGALAVILAAGLTLAIWQGDGAEPPLRLYRFWGVIVWLPWVAGIAVATKACVAAWAWSVSLKRRLVTPRTAGRYFLSWVLATILVAAMPWVAFPGTVWLRDLLLLLSLLVTPLGGPALAMLAFTRNRCRS